MANLLNVLRTAGFSGERLREAWAIAMRESGGNASAHNDNAATGDDSYGIFQINMLGPLAAERDAKFKQHVPGYTGIDSLYDPVINARAAAYMSQHGANWQSWVSPQYGAAATFYKQYPGDPGDTETVPLGTNPDHPVATPTGAPVVPTETAITGTDESAKILKGKGAKKAFAENQAVSWDFVQSHQDVKDVFQEAIDNGWNDPKTGEVGKQSFINAIQNTSWYRDNNEFARNYLFLKSQGGADYKDELNAARLAVQTEAAKVGAVLDDGQTAGLAEQYLMNGWNDPARSRMLTQALTGNLPGFDHSYLDYSKGGAAALVATLKKTANDNGVQYDDSYYQGAAAAILGGLTTADTYVQDIREKAATLYPTYGDRVRTGEQTVRSLASPYISTMAQTLELNPNSISLNDDSIRGALGASDDKGNPMPLSLYDYQQQLRKDPRWLNTQQAQDQYSNVAKTVLEKFGVM